MSRFWKNRSLIHLISWKIISFNASYFAIAILFSLVVDLRGVESNYLLKYFPFSSFHPLLWIWFLHKRKIFMDMIFIAQQCLQLGWLKKREAERYHRKIALSDWALIQLWWIWIEVFCSFTTSQIHILLEGVILIFLLLLQSGSRFSFASYCAISPLIRSE